MLRDLLLCARGLALHVVAANARAEVRAYSQLVDMMSRIVAHNMLRDGSLENATCARGTDQAKLNAAGGNLDCSVDSAWFFGSLGSATSNGANKSAMLRAE